jgi:hypothetical protein
MKYMTVWTIRPENMKAVIKRFKEADPKVKGVKITRFHVMGTGRGFSLTESDDPVAIAKFASSWSDLVEQETFAVVGDAEISEALK